MNAPEHLPVARAPINDAVTIPLNLITYSRTQPRHRPDEAVIEKAWNLRELAATIKEHGVMQPILVRPIVDVMELLEGDDGVWVPRPGVSGPHYEIIAGERRWRASRIAGADIVPALIRPMSDFKVLQLQVIENDQREDLHAIDQGEGYRRLLRKEGDSEGYANVDELADHIGKSRRFVYNRLALCQLGDAARKACFDGRLSPSTALLVARLPVEVHAEATKLVLDGWGGEPLSFRQAQQRLEERFMLQLSKAPFKITDASLVPAAGSCRECPKRTGANPDLFDDIKSADTCTDAKCFHAKRDAHQALLMKAAEAKGLEVISGAAAKKLLPHRGSDLKDFVRLDKPDYNVDYNKPLAKVLGKDCPPVTLLEDPHTHELIEVVRKEQARAVLKKKGLLKTKASSPDSKAEAQAKAATKWRTAAVETCMTKVLEIDGADAINAFAIFMWPQVALHLWRELGNDDERRASKLMGWDFCRGVSREKEVEAMSWNELGRFITMLCLVGESHVHTYHSQPNHAPRIKVFAEQLGVDVQQVRNDVTARAKAKALTPAERKAKAAAKHADAPLTPEKALAAAVASSKGEGGKQKTVVKATAKKVSAADATKTIQTDKTAKLHAKKVDPKKPSDSPKGSNQKDEPAAPAFKIGDAVQQRKVDQRRKTRLCGIVEQVHNDGTMLVRASDGEAKICVASYFELQSPGDEGDKPLPLKTGGVISAEAAWPFPTATSAV